MFSLIHKHSCKHAGMGQYRASTGPMLAASDQYWSGTGPLWHVYGDVSIDERK